MSGVAIIVVCSCGHHETEPAAITAPKPAYRLMTLTQRNVAGAVRLPGVMQPFEAVELFPRVAGYVKTVPVDRGSAVNAGQVLLTMEAPELDQEAAGAGLRFSQANTAWLTAKEQYMRLLASAQTPGTVSAFDITTAHDKMLGDSAVMRAEYADFKAKEAMKNYLVLTAPFAGVITERNVHPGALASAGGKTAQPWLVLQQTSKLRLTVDVPEQYLEQVAQGDTVSYRLNALHGKVFHGKVTRLARSLTSNYRAEAIEIDVDNAGGRFAPGMYAEVMLPITGSANAFPVPRSAVVTSTERKYIVVAEGGVARIKDVVEGNSTGDTVEVFGNLNPGAQVVVNADYRLKDDTPLQ